MSIKDRIRLDVTYEITPNYEVVPIRGNIIYSGDLKLDKQVEDDTPRELKQRNVWAWCNIEVRAHWRGLCGISYLGHYPYKNESDFKSCGYYEDMKEEALSDLCEQIKRVQI